MGDDQCAVFAVNIRDIVKAGDRMMAQATTWGIQFHVRERHPGAYEDCGNGACRSTYRQCRDWRALVGWNPESWQ
jgi:hypothetical protein